MRTRDIAKGAGKYSPIGPISLICGDLAPDRRSAHGARRLRRVLLWRRRLKTERLQAFSDGVIAVIITIMVLELKAPHGADLGALLDVLPAFLSYVLSFIYVGLYWNNHHHFFQLVDRVTGGILWANLHLLFWLSLIPFATAWLNEHPMSAVPTALYGGVLLAAAGAWMTMQTIIIRTDRARRPLARGDRTRPQRTNLAGAVPRRNSLCVLQNLARGCAFRYSRHHLDHPRSTCRACGRRDGPADKPAGRRLTRRRWVWTRCNLKAAWQLRPILRRQL